MSSPADPANLAVKAINANDLAARLESSGLGDAYARTLGYSDVFALSDYLFAVRGDTLAPIAVAPPNHRNRLRDALFRAAVIGLGMVLSILALPPNLPITTIAAAGVVSWFTAHVTAAVAWAELGHRGMNAVAWILRPVVLAGLAIALGISLATGSTAPLIWGIWGVSAGVLLPTVRTSRLTIVLALLTAPAVATTVLTGTHGGRLAATIALLGAATMAGHWVLSDRLRVPDQRPRRLPWHIALTRPEIRIPAVQAMIQVGAQALCFLALFFALLPAGRAGIGFGCLVAAVLSDPVLTTTEAVSDRLTRQARGRVWLQSRLAGLAVASTAVVGVIAAAAAYAWPTPAEVRLTAAGATALIALVGLTVSVPLRAGLGRQATYNVLLAALPGLTLVLTLPILPVSLPTGLAISLAIVAALAMLAHVHALNSPNRW